MVIPSQTTEILNQIALDLYAGRIFCDRQVTSGYPSLLGAIFMPIALGAFSDFKPEEVKGIGLIYEYLNKAGPRCINGYPIFMSLNILNIGDTQIVLEKLRILEATMAQALGQTTATEQARADGTIAQKIKPGDVQGELFTEPSDGVLAVSSPVPAEPAGAGPEV